MDDRIAQYVCEALEQITLVPTIQGYFSLVDHLAMDSLDFLELCIELEDSVYIEGDLPAHEFRGWKTVQDIIDYVEREHYGKTS